MANKFYITTPIYYVNLDTLVKDGDEVAFFPPVTGG